MLPLPKCILFLLVQLSACLCYGQVNTAVIAEARVALMGGEFQKALVLLEGAEEQGREGHYIMGLALEGVDSLLAAASHWHAYLQLTEGREEAQAYHRGLGRFCLANNYLLRGQWREAEGLLRQSLAGAGSYLPDTLSAKIWNSYGVLQVQEGKQAAAHESFKTSTKYWELAGRGERAVISRYYSGRILLWKDPSSAAEELKGLLDLGLAPLDDLHPAVIALTLCEAYLRDGRIVLAREALAETDKRIEQHEKERSFEEEAYYAAIKGLLELREGRVAQAQATFGAMGDDRGMGVMFLPAEQLYFQGLGLQHSGHFEQAIEFYEEAIAIVEERDWRFSATLYQLLGECHLGQNSFTLSLAQFEQAEARWDKLGDSGSGAWTKLLMAEALLHNRDTVTAQQKLGDLQVLCLRADNDSGHYETCIRLTEVLQGLGLARTAVPVLERLFLRVDSLPDLMQARLLAGKAFREKEKGEIAPARYYSGLSIAALGRHWSEMRGIEGVRLQRNYFDRVFQLGISCALAEGDLGGAVRLGEVVKGLDLKGVILGDLSLGSEEEDYLDLVASALTEDQALVIYLKGLDSLYAVVLEKDRLPRAVVLGSWHALEYEVEQYLGYLADPVTMLDLDRELANSVYADICRLGFQLHQQLVVPLEVTASSELLIVPDGKLHFLSFAGLLSSLPEHPNLFNGHDYLVRQHAVAYLPTLSLLLEQKNVPSGNYKVVAFAPTYDAAGSSLPPLLNNQEEVRKLAGQFQGEFHYGKGAVKEALPTDEEASGRLLHLSMHAVFNADWPDSSWLAFSGYEDGGEAAWYYATDIGKQFAAHPFVFLSACQTANGALYRGEGALSLTRSMMARGNRHIVSSLWNVDDGRVGGLIFTFYEALGAGDSSLKALQAAQLGYLESANPQDAYPYYWAGLLHYGVAAQVSPRAVFIWWPYLLGLVLLVASFSFGSFYWKRDENFTNGS